MNTLVSTIVFFSISYPIHVPRTPDQFGRKQTSFSVNTTHIV